MTLGKKEKSEIIYGIHPVLEALRAGRRKFYGLYVTTEKIPKRLEDIVTFAESLSIPVKVIKAPMLKTMAATELHQGIGAKVSPYPVAGISDSIGRTKSSNESQLFLLLDNVVDPHNLGALVRTALCTGVDGVFIPKDRSVSPTPTVSKASAGALEHVSLIRVTNLVNTIKALKKSGIWGFGLDRMAVKSIYETVLTCPAAIIIGGEGKGIRDLVKKNCDFLISIPQKGPVDSLNASVAGAVVMYEVFRQRELKA